MAASKKHALYVTRVPIVLGALSIALFVVAALTMGIWNQGWQGSLLLALLSFETFFLPYALLPLAVWLPTLLPWVRYDRGHEFCIEGAGRLRQRAAVAALLLLPGIATLGAFGEAAAMPALWQQALMALALGARVPVILFAVLSTVLALPDFTKAEA